MMGTSTEMRKDYNGGAVEMQDTGDGIQGRNWIRAAEDSSSVDSGQRVHR